MLSDGPTRKDVFGEYVKKSLERMQYRIASFVIDCSVAQGQTGMRKYPRDSVDREIRRNGEK